MSIDDDLWFETCKRLRARVSPRPATDPPPVTFAGDEADDLSWLLAEAMMLPSVRADLRRAEAQLDAARAAFASAKGRRVKGKTKRPTTAARAAAACRALGLIRPRKRAFTRDRAAILHDWISLRAARVLRGVIDEPGLPVPKVIAEITRRHGFPREAACLHFLRGLRTEIVAAHGEEAGEILADLPGDPTYYPKDK